jgi:hypothetical protein
MLVSAHTQLRVPLSPGAIEIWTYIGPIMSMKARSETKWKYLLNITTSGGGIFLFWDDAQNHAQVAARKEVNRFVPIIEYNEAA